jgi:hypothetical protein
MSRQDRVLQALKEAPLGAGIDLPYPTMQVLFHDQTETTDGDRARRREEWPGGTGGGPGGRDLAAALRAQGETHSRTDSTKPA